MWEDATEFWNVNKISGQWSVLTQQDMSCRVRVWVSCGFVVQMLSAKNETTKPHETQTRNYTNRGFARISSSKTRSQRSKTLISKNVSTDLITDHVLSSQFQNMKNLNSFLALALLLAVSLSCSLLKNKTSKTSSSKIDFTAPGKSLDVKVVLDKKQTSSGKIGKAGGNVSLTAADGSEFSLDVPANALATETTITMTAVKTVDGSPLDKNTPAAVQLGPSGLFFKEMATLTIVPANEIPVKEQIIFGYEGDGKEFHLAPVDPKSKEIKVKLMGFSGAGVGSGSDASWAAHQMIEASNASTRLVQKLGELTQGDRRETLLGKKEGASTEELFRPFIEAFYDQVVLKEIAAAELDCKHAQKALNDLTFIERTGELANLAAEGSDVIPGFREKMARLQELGRKCKKSYRAEGASDGASFKGDICDVNQPFTINVDSITGKWPMHFTPESDTAGRMEGTFSSNGCTLTGGGPYTISIGEDGAGTITFTYNSTATCPFGTTTTSRTSTLPLKPAPELNCP